MDNVVTIPVNTLISLIEENAHLKEKALFEAELREVKAQHEKEIEKKNQAMDFWMNKFDKLRKLAVANGIIQEDEIWD